MWVQLLLILPMAGDGKARVLMKQEETKPPEEANHEELTQNGPAGLLSSRANPLHVGVVDEYPGCWLPDVGAIPVYQPFN